MSDGDRRLVLYGTLMRGLRPPAAPRVLERLGYLGPCRLPGRLLDFGRFPGLVPGHGEVLGELYELPGPEPLDALVDLDAYESCDPHDPEHSLYVRQLVALTTPSLDAWVYVYNGATRGAGEVPDGDWRAHVAG